jgi:hypothetical protein
MIRTHLKKVFLLNGRIPILVSRQDYNKGYHSYERRKAVK